MRETIRVLPNPVDLDRMRRPDTFDRDSFRKSVGLCRNDVVFVFVAQGHFERKGLPLLIDAIQLSGSESVKLLVVGGEPRAIAPYKWGIAKRGLASRVIFTGMQSDVRLWLWSADCFTLPSFYEVFPLVSLEAAASGLPLIVSRMNGVEEFIRDGQNGLLVERTPCALALAFRQILSMTDAERRLMGDSARQDVARYATSEFVNAWDQLYGGPPVAESRTDIAARVHTGR
jgi:glycosyltransferase involved in cell wall biosynthesis